MAETLKNVGVLLGVAAFLWKVWDAFQSFLHINLSLFREADQLLAKVVVENRGVFRKRIDNAILLIGPEHESPIDTFNKLETHRSVASTNEIVMCVYEARIENADRALIPLPFFYSENVRIADESLSYTVPVTVGSFRPGSSYSVRLFVAGGRRLHRTTQAAFIAENDGSL